MEAGSAPHTRSYGVDKKMGVTGQSNGAGRRSDSHAAVPAHTGYPPRVHVIHGTTGRIVCVADIRGHIQQLNQIAAEHKAAAIIHTGDFGFYTRESLDRIGERTLRHVVQYSPLLSNKLRSVLLDSADAHAPLANGTAHAHLRQMFADHPDAVLSEFPQLLSKQITLDVPVFTVYGACEDVEVLERLRSGEYSVPNLYILDEASTHAIDVGSLRLRLLGLGGAVVTHKLFDHGVGNGTLAGGHGTMWTSMLQIGELMEAAQHVYDPTEVRVFVSFASPGRDGLVAQLAHALRADYCVSGGLHLRYVTSYNDFGVYGQLDTYRAKLSQANAEFQDVWDAVRPQVEAAIDPSQRTLLNQALQVALHVPQPVTAGANRDDAFKNLWQWNLPDASVGSLVLDISHGRVATEMRSQGVSFASRRSRAAAPPVKVALPSSARDKTSMPPAAAAAVPAATAPLAVALSQELPAQILHTLFLGHLGEAHPVSEADIRAYFGEHAANIAQIHFFPSDRERRGKEEGEPRMRNFVHVEFKSDAAAAAALQCRGKPIKDTSVVPTLELLERPRAKVKSPKDRADDHAPTSRTRGGRRGRGGRGGRNRNNNNNSNNAGSEPSSHATGHDMGENTKAAPGGDAVPAAPKEKETMSA
ncbi:hypothetical protein MEQU1_000625 [Malassezia equina]|uniref:DUF2433 domain-containing protein n=1 Tax=Malassezia equina TaxID=1381935 RepID=A0AAF0ECC9_9BASI|nr:hypothetical protein MEQU1_000625 [Malassezia equina]